MRAEQARKRIRERPGRPQRASAPGERVPMSFRVEPQLKERMEQASARSGRSVAGEIELRLVQADTRESLLVQVLELAYGRRAAGVVMAVMHAFVREGRIAGFASGGTFTAMERWLDDPFAFARAAEAAVTALEAFRPAGDPSVLKVSGKTSDAVNMGKEGAEIMLAAIRDPNWGDQFAEGDRNRELEQLGAQVRELFGPLPDRGADPEKA
jgi:hypothetical protein